MKNNKLAGYIIAAIMLVLLLAANICLLTQKKWWSDAWDIEIMKIWWQDNWNLVEKFYKSDYYINQQTQAIDATLAEFSDEWNTTDNTQNSEDIMTIVEDLLATAPVRGDKDARFTIIEYTELLCPYCQRHSQAGTIQAVMDKYPGEVNSVSRHYIIHGQTALELAAAMECVAELKSDVYYDVFEDAFESYPVDMDTLKNIAIDEGVKKADLEKCIDEWRYTKAVEDMMNQWATIFGIQWTPGNVIIDRETGKYQVLPWAYPADNFYEIIDSMK